MLVSLRLEISDYEQDVKEHTNLPAFDLTSHIVRFT
jgi:hypothetical protein